jgi:hypothetical protein
MFAFPQLLGVLLYFRVSRVSRWLAVIAATLAPALFFFWLTRMLFMAQMREAYARGEVCGMPGLACAILLLAGTTIHLVVALITQLALLASRRRKSPASQ